MVREDIVSLLQEVIRVDSPIAHHTNWVNFSCVFAPWKHTHGTDSSPSAGISVNDDGVSIYHCLGCGSKGSLPWVLRQLERYTGEDYENHIAVLERGEYLGGELPEWGVKPESFTHTPRILSDEYLDIYDTAEGHPYLRARGITPATAKHLQLMIDPADSRGEERILFPVFTPDKKLLGFTGRAVRNKVEPRIRDYHGLQKANALLGSHLISPEDKEIVLVEGLFDFAKVYQYGYSVVAAMHASLTHAQAKILDDIGKPVIVMFDNDVAGWNGVESVRHMLKGLPLRTVEYPTRERNRGGVTCVKDPGMCTMSEVDQMVSEAEIL